MFSHRFLRRAPPHESPRPADKPPRYIETLNTGHAMQHVREIRAIAERGEAQAAHEALDNLLALGPKNTEALKLRAMLFEREGKFADEHKTWNKIMQIDQEDADLLAYVLRRQTEEREHFYFTDDLPGGGRRYRTYPRSLVQMSFIGFAGCVGFLLISRLIPQMPIIGPMGQGAQAILTLGLFALMVLGPWFGIMWIFLRMLTSLSVSRFGIEFKTSLKRTHLPWQAVDQVVIAHAIDGDDAYLDLVIVPKDQTLPLFKIDLRAETSSIRARSFLVHEISRMFREPYYLPASRLPAAERQVKSF